MSPAAAHKLPLLSVTYSSTVHRDPERVFCRLAALAAFRANELVFFDDCGWMGFACVCADQLKDIGVVDEVIWEPAQGETHDNFPIMAG